MNTKALTNTVFYTTGEVVPRIISFLMMPVFTKYLSPADYGILSYTNSIIVFISVLCTLSLNTYVLRFYFDCKTEDEQKKLIGNIFVFIALINFVALLLLNFMGPLIIDTIHISVPWKPYFCIAVVNNFLESFSIIPMAYYRVKQDAKLFVGISIGRCVLQYVLTFVMLAVMGLGVMSQYYGNFFTLLLFFFLYFYIIIKHVKISFEWNLLKGALKFSLPLLPGAISYLALTSFDRVVLERYVSLEIIGIYNIAFTIAFALNMVIQSFYRALEPNIFQMYNMNGKNETFVLYLHKINNIYNFALYALALFLSLFAKEVLMIVANESYYSAAFYVPLVLVGVLFSGRNLLISCVLTAEKRSIINGIGTIIGAAISITINIFLIPKMGVVATPIALSVSYMVMNIYLKKSMKVKFFNNLQDVFAMILFLGASMLSMMNLAFSESLLILIKTITYIVTMLLIAFVFNLFSFVREEISSYVVKKDV